MHANLSPVEGLGEEQSVLVVGCGSIGTRHLENLRALGVRELAAADPVRHRLEIVGERFGAELFPNVGEALSHFSPRAVFICTPPVSHVDYAREALSAGAHVFIEKPLSDSHAKIESLKLEAAACKRVVQVGYNLRFHPGIGTLKRLVQDSVVGRILWARAEVGQFLPDWHPAEDYRQGYTARRELGGGIILDASHEIDYMLWILGAPVELTCMAGKLSDLDVDVEDCATLLLKFASGAQADVHLDFIQRNYSRSCVFAGEEGEIAWDYCAGAVEIARPGKQLEVISYRFQTNEMYMDEARHFFDCIERGVRPSCGIAEAAQTLSVALAAKTAASEKRWVSLNA